MIIEFQHSTAQAILRNMDNVASILAPLNNLVEKGSEYSSDTSDLTPEDSEPSSSNELNLLKQSLKRAISGDYVDLDFIKIEPVSSKSFSVTMEPHVAEKLIDATGNYIQQCIGPLFQLSIAAKAFITAVPQITTGVK